MSKNMPLITSPEIIPSTPRAQRGAAAVIAQYIQDLTHPAQSDLCAAAA